MILFFVTENRIATFFVILNLNISFSENYFYFYVTTLRISYNKKEQCQSFNGIRIFHYDDAVKWEYESYMRQIGHKKLGIS